MTTLGSGVSLAADAYGFVDAVLTGDAVGVASGAAGVAGASVPGTRLERRVWDAGRNGAARFVRNWPGRRAAQDTAVRSVQSRAASTPVDEICR